MKRIVQASILALAVASLTACPDAKKRPLGGSCGSDDECAEGVCIASLCLDPEGDEDGDGLTNQLEGALGTNPVVADTDGDGISDGDEVGQNVAAPIDTDADGKVDAIESNTNDADQDCVNDQLDADDANPEVDPAKLGRLLCKKVGACAAEGAVVTASCPNGGGVATCSYTGVPEYEEDEARCDSVDNDCDGSTDERYASGGTVTFDGGPNAADAGKVLGDTCGAGACAGGRVVCAVDVASLVCSTSDRAGALACASDMNCNGTPDESEVADPITTPLAQCEPYYTDGDGDTFGAGDPACLCAASGKYVTKDHSDCVADDIAIHPGAKGICGVDADCDLALRDADEACDDGNTDEADGCNECVVTPKAVSEPLGYPSGPVLAGLKDGGFVVAYDAGYGGNEQWQGRAIIVYGADGKVAKRMSGLGVDDANISGEGFVTALGDGGFAYGYWRWGSAGEVDFWDFMVQRFDADGEARGDAVLLYSADTTLYDTVFFPLAGGVGVVFRNYTPNGVELLVRRMNGEGVVLEYSGSIAVSSSVSNIEALGFDDGTVLVAWTDYDFTTYENFHRAVRLDVNGKPTSEPFEIAPANIFARRFSLARDGAGWAFFFLADRYEGETSYTTVGYQRYDGLDKALGDLTFLKDDDTDGCPYDFIGGFDGSGRAWSVVTDGECQSPTRGWFEGSNDILDFSPALEREPRTYDIGAAPVGDGFVFAFVAGGQELPQALYLRRYAAELTPTYLPPSE